VRSLFASFFKKLFFASLFLKGFCEAFSPGFFKSLFASLFRKRAFVFSPAFFAKRLKEGLNTSSHTILLFVFAK